MKVLGVLYVEGWIYSFHVRIRKHTALCRHTQYGMWVSPGESPGSPVRGGMDLFLPRTNENSSVDYIYASLNFDVHGRFSAIFHMYKKTVYSLSVRALIKSIYLVGAQVTNAILLFSEL